MLQRRARYLESGWKSARKTFSAIYSKPHNPATNNSTYLLVGKYRDVVATSADIALYIEMCQ